MFIFICFLTLVTVKTSLSDLDLLALQPGNVTSFYGSTVNHLFGLSVRAAGDFNGDNVDDVIIGSPSASSDPGVAYIIYGNKNGVPDLTTASLDSSQGFTIIGPTGSNTFGWAVSAAGDLNGDTIDDVIIGAVYESTSSGAAYVLFGTKIPRTTSTLTIDPTTLQSSGQGFTISGTVSGDCLGNMVSYLGDINADGLDDMIVGAYASQNTYAGAGKAYVIFGRNAATTPITDIILTSPLSNTLGFTIGGDSPNEFVGSYVSSGGDFNGDGINDIIVGAFRSSSEPGTAYFIFGHSGITDITVPSGLTSAKGFQIRGIMNGDYLGWSASASDINGDGFSDIIVGAVNSGIAYVIYGKAGRGVDIDLASTSLSSNGLGFTIFSSNTGNKLGYAVTTAGDLNGDEIEDLALTTLLSGPTGIISTATAYVIFGSKSGLSDIDVTSLSINQGIVIANLVIGSSFLLIPATPISFAGDVNADGGADLIIASPSNTNSPSIYGSAYILYGIPVPKPNPLQAIVDTGNFATAVGRVVAMASSLFNSQSIIPLWFIFLEQILQYPQYLLIEYPPKLKLIYEDQEGFQLFSIPDISQIPDDLNEEITEYSLPEKFEENGYDSSFLVNFWNSLMTLLIIIVLIVIALIADRCTISNQSLYPFFSKVKYTLKWNYIISMFTGTFCDIALFTSFEMRTVHFDTVVEWVSFFLCILLNLVVIAVLIKIVLIIKKFAKRKSLPDQNRRRKRLTQISQDELKSYQVVFEGFKDQTLKQQSYFLLFSLRFYLFYTIIGYLFEHTLVQAILINLIGISTLLYLGFVRPFEDKIDFIVSLTQEGALQIIHSCVFLFALDDQINFASQGFRVVLGDIILVGNAVFMGTSMIYTFILSLVLLKKIYVLISKKCCKQNKINSIKQTRPTPTASNENKTELDKVNESELYLNRVPTVEQELSSLTINVNQHKDNSNVLNNSTLERSLPQIANSNAFLTENRLTFLNPRREERKRVEREKLAAESNTKPERVNQLKRRKK